MLWWVALVFAGSLCEVAAPDDPGEVWVVSVAPGLDPASSWGHTLLVLAGDGRPATAWSWGAYDGRAEGAAWAFVRGRLPYLLVDLPWEAERWRIRERGRHAVGQRLTLEPHEVAAVFAAVDRAGEGPRTYPYDWRTRNCTTMARDVVDAALGGAWSASVGEAAPVVIRTEIRRGFHRLPVHDLTWSFFAGPAVDLALGPLEQTLFPARWMEALDRGVRADGRPWVAERCTVVDGPLGWPPEAPAPTWPWALPGLVVGGVAVGARDRRWSGLVVAGWGALLAGLGLVTGAWWAVTDLRGAGPTAGWWLAGPSSLVLVGAGIRRLRGASADGGWRLALGGMVALALAGSPFVAEGVALALLPGVLACAWASWAPKEG